MFVCVFRCLCGYVRKLSEGGRGRDRLLEDGDTMICQNIGNDSPSNATYHPRQLGFSAKLMSQPQILEKFVIFDRGK